MKISLSRNGTFIDATFNPISLAHSFNDHILTCVLLTVPLAWRQDDIDTLAAHPLGPGADLAAGSKGTAQFAFLGLATSALKFRPSPKGLLASLNQSTKKEKKPCRMQNRATSLKLVCLPYVKRQETVLPTGLAQGEPKPPMNTTKPTPRGLPQPP